MSSYNSESLSTRPNMVTFISKFVLVTLWFPPLPRYPPPPRYTEHKAWKAVKYRDTER